MEICDGGVGDSKGLLESELRQRHIKWITNAKVTEASAEMVKVKEHDATGNVIKHELTSRFNMFIPALTGYIIESMVTAIVHNIVDSVAGLQPSHRATWNAICLADLGDDGVAFVALPQIPPRNVTWAKQGKWVHLAKIAFEKYFMRKMRTGSAEPVYEKYVLKALGIMRLKGDAPK